MIWLGDLDEKFVKRFLAGTWLMLAAFIAAGNIFWSEQGTLGIIVGGVLANLNCLGIYRDIFRMVRAQHRIVYFASMLGRLLIIALVVLIVLKKFPGRVSVPGMITGFSVVPATFLMVVIQMQIGRFRGGNK